MPATLAEAEALVRRLGGEHPLVDAAATRGNVGSALASASWAHFACHAHSDPASPSNSCSPPADPPETGPASGRVLDY